MSIVIAVDGTAASGKGTLAKALAAHFKFAHLDTGALYRLVAFNLLQSGGSSSNETEILFAAKNIDPNQATNVAIRSAKIGRVAAVVAAIPSVRRQLLNFQRAFAESPPGGARGSIIDGRDIGTVVCPNADVKFFIDAAPAIRAHRRYLELKNTGHDASETEILNDLINRDAADQMRTISPLVPAEDAKKIDTTNIGVSEMCSEAISVAEHVFDQKNLCWR